MSSSNGDDKGAEVVALGGVGQEWADFSEWLEYGRGRGWCSEVVCDTHDGLPRTEEEEAAWEEGWDPCEYAIRVWP